jgi:hypothetical protein
VEEEQSNLERILHQTGPNPSVAGPPEENAKREKQHPPYFEVMKCPSYSLDHQEVVMNTSALNKSTLISRHQVRQFRS